MTLDLDPLQLLSFVKYSDCPLLFTFFPSKKQILEPFQLAYNDMCHDIQTAWTKVEKIEGKTEFANIATQSQCSVVLFWMKKWRENDVKETLVNLSLSEYSTMILKLKDFKFSQLFLEFSKIPFEGSWK